MSKQKGEPMKKLIYLEDAIDAIQHKLGVKNESCLLPSEKAIVEILKSLPFADPEPQWILCEQRMPEEHEWMGTKRYGTTISDEVYVTFESPDGVRFTKHLCFQNGKLSNYTQDTIDVFHKGAVPIAWRPLPEPYGGEE